MKGYCDNDHPLWQEREGDGEGCLSWECPEHVRHSWTGERPVSPQTYSARVEAPDTERRAFVARDGQTYLRVGVAEFLTSEGHHPWEEGKGLTNEELAEDEENYLAPRTE